MSQLTFPVSPDGLVVDVLINVAGARMASLRAAGQPIPSLIQARGLINTGSTIPVVASPILQQRPAWGEDLRAACFPEEIEERHCHAEAGY